MGEGRGIYSVAMFHVGAKSALLRRFFMLTHKKASFARSFAPSLSQPLALGRDLGSGAGLQACPRNRSSVSKQKNLQATASFSAKGNGSRPQDVCQRRSMFDLPFRLKHRIIYGSTHHCNCPHNRGNIESALSSWQQPGCRAFIAGGILPRALVRSVGEMGWTQNAAIPEAAGACVPCPEIQLDETGPSCYNSGKLERTAHPPGARKRHAGNTNLR